MRHAPVSASVTSASGAPCVISAACKAACSRRSRTMRRVISIRQSAESSSLLRRAEAVRAGGAEVERFVLEVFSLHLDGQVVNAELFVELGAQRAEQLGGHGGACVSDVRGERVAPRGDCPDVQVVYILDARGL